MRRISPGAAARELIRRASARANFILHDPHPKQKEFLSLQCFEALYGGAAGGGKTDALLMAAAQYVHVPAYAALILRRTYADLALPNAIMDRAKQWWIPQGVAWNDKDKRFTFPSGATITFGYLDTERDRYRYAGSELQFIAFDELTQFPQTWYTFLLSRLRRLSGSEVPTRVRAASNPGGIGHDWVRRRFIESNELTRAFVPATLEDNPSIDRADYAKTLQNLDPTTRKQLLDGVWVRDGGGLVYAQFDEIRNRVHTVPPITHYLLGLDFGIDDENAVTILGWRPHDPCIYVVESYRRKGLVSEMCEEVRELEKRFHFVKIVGDTGGMGKAFAEEMRQRFTLPVVAAEKNNKIGYISLLNGDLARGRIKLSTLGCEHLVDEWRELPWDATRTKECEGFDNHASDSMLYAWRACTAYHEAPQAPAPIAGSFEAMQAKAEELERLAIEEIDQEYEAERIGRW